VARECIWEIDLQPGSFAGRINSLSERKIQGNSRVSKSEGGSKYSQRGAYHWKQISSSIGDHNVYVSARYKKILDRLGEIKGKDVLDVGGGDGALSYLLARNHGSPMVIDISFLALQYARSEFNKHRISIECLQGSAERLPFSDESFDAVVGCEVIEHLSNQTDSGESSESCVPMGCWFSPLHCESRVSFMRTRAIYAGELAGSLENYFSSVKFDSAPVFGSKSI
jgi:SAM-dependent methyltransferase